MTPPRRRAVAILFRQAVPAAQAIAGSKEGRFINRPYASTKPNLAPPPLAGRASYLRRLIAVLLANAM
jgi:hypothetical protein